jgi:hypothetical protein
MLLQPFGKESQRWGNTMDATPALERFITRRERCLARFDKVRSALDVWVAEHRVAGTPIAEYAYFEGLLGERRTALEELLAIDDELLDYFLLAQNNMTRPEPAIDRTG